MEFDIPEFESVANILRHPPETPNKRSSLFVFKDMIDNSTSVEDEDAHCPGRKPYWLRGGATLSREFVRIRTRV